MSDRSGQPVVERVEKSHDRSGQPVCRKRSRAEHRTSTDKDLIWTDSESKSSPTVRRKSGHEFQANYDRRSIQKLSETIASQRGELHRAQAEELHRRDQQLLHEQLLKQNWDLREAHEKGLKEMEELKFHFRHCCRRRLVEDQDTILELARYRICKMKLIV